MKTRKNNIQFLSSSNSYCFGDDKTFNATKKTQLPVNIGGHKAMTETDVIDSVMSLLLSRASMK